MVVTTKNFDVGYEPIRMIYTGVGYILAFAIMVHSILNKKIFLFRAIFVALFLMSIPASAIIGMIVAVISMLLSFNKKVKMYFDA